MNSYNYSFPIFFLHPTVIEIANGAIKFWDYHMKMQLSWKDYSLENEKSKRIVIEQSMNSYQQRIEELSQHEHKMRTAETEITALRNAFERTEYALNESERYVLALLAEDCDDFLVLCVLTYFCWKALNSPSPQTMQKT